MIIQVLKLHSSKLTEGWKDDNAVKEGVAGSSVPRAPQKFREFVLAESKKYY